MNWTGGKLQRHSKANSNAQVKAQRDYFARARLRRNTQPLASTAPNIPIVTPPDQPGQSRRSPNPRNQSLAINDERLRKGSRRSKPLQDAACGAHSIVQQYTLHRKTEAQQSPSTSTPQVKTLEHVKTSLLKQSDWLGLTLTRPPKTEYKPPTIPEKVGRRRRVNREDRQRQKYRAGKRKIEQHFVQTVAEVDDYNYGQPIPSAELSIRFGSNIHQSQPTRSQRAYQLPKSASQESSSTEAMLLDVVEAQLLPTVNDSGEYYLEEPKDGEAVAAGSLDGRSDQEDSALISLEQVRDFPSFDEVKRYSSSAKHTASLSSRSACKPADTKGQFTSDSYNHSLMSIDSEPPGFTENRESAMKQDRNSGASVVDISSTGRKLHDLRCFEPASAITQRSSLDFKNSSRVSSHAHDAVDETETNHEIRSASDRDSSSSMNPRSVYTIDRQVQLEKERNQKFNQLVHPTNTGGLMPSGIISQYYRKPRVVEKMPAGEKRGLPTRYYTTQDSTFTKKPHGQSTSIGASSKGSHQRRQGDENEAWMRDVFSTDFGKLQQRFSFAKAPERRSHNETLSQERAFRGQRIEAPNRSDSPEKSISSSRYSSDPSLPKTIKTGVNTVLNMGKESEPPQQRNIFIPSETDFLTQMSPMTGYLDDRIVNLSTYNNAATTVRDYIEPQHMAAKRTASEAFGDRSYEHYDTSPLSDSKLILTSSPAPHRVPLNTLHQAPVRAHPLDESLALHEESQYTLRPIWRHAKAPSPVNKNRARPSLVSKEHFEQKNTTHSQHAQIPLDYTPMRISTPRYRMIPQVETPELGLDMTTSRFYSQYSSPARSSDHRVPLSSGLAAEDPGGSRHDKQQYLVASSRLETMTSQHTNHMPTLSSSCAPTRQSNSLFGDAHTLPAQQFVFRRPQRPAAKYAHPSRSTTQFTPSKRIPLH
jgi:hypothetical protein